MAQLDTIALIESLLTISKENKLLYSTQALILLRGMIFASAMVVDVGMIRALIGDITLTKDITDQDFGRICRRCARILDRSADNILDEASSVEVYR